MDKFLVRTVREARSEQAPPRAAAPPGRQRTLGDLARTVRLPPGVTARAYSDEFVLSLKAVLDDPGGGEQEVALALQQLSCLIITEACLRNTQAAKSVKDVAGTHASERVRKAAASLYRTWKAAIHAEREGTSSLVGPDCSGDKPASCGRRRGASTSSSSSSGPRLSGFFAQEGALPRSQEQQQGCASTEAIRGRAVKMLFSALCHDQEQREGGGATADRGPGAAGAAPCSDPDRCSGGGGEAHLRSLAEQAERALASAILLQAAAPPPPGRPPPRSASAAAALPQAARGRYAQRVRELAASLRRNEVLRAKVAAGFVAPGALAGMGPGELACRDMGELAGLTVPAKTHGGDLR